MTRTMRTLEQRLTLTEERVSSLLAGSRGIVTISPDGFGPIRDQKTSENIDVDEQDGEEEEENDENYEQNYDDNYEFEGNKRFYYKGRIIFFCSMIFILRNVSYSFCYLFILQATKMKSRSMLDSIVQRRTTKNTRMGSKWSHYMWMRGVCEEIFDTYSNQFSDIN